MAYLIYISLFYSMDQLLSIRVFSIGPCYASIKNFHLSYTCFSIIYALLRKRFHTSRLRVFFHQVLFISHFGSTAKRYLSVINEPLIPQKILNLFKQLFKFFIFTSLRHLIHLFLIYNFLASTDVSTW